VSEQSLSPEQRALLAEAWAMGALDKPEDQVSPEHREALEQLGRLLGEQFIAGKSTDEVAEFLVSEGMPQSQAGPFAKRMALTATLSLIRKLGGPIQRRLTQGASREQIVAELVQDGLAKSLAADLVDRLAEARAQVMKRPFFRFLRFLRLVK